MESEAKRPVAKKGALVTCPDCQGTGKVLKTFPFRANPKATATRGDRTTYRPCPTCRGTGQVSAT